MMNTARGPTIRQCILCRFIVGAGGQRLVSVILSAAVPYLRHVDHLQLVLSGHCGIVVEPLDFYAYCVRGLRVKRDVELPRVV